MHAGTQSYEVPVRVQPLPSLYAEHEMVVRPEPYSIQPQQLLFVESPEPIQLLARVAPGPRSLVQEPVPAPPPPAPLILLGPRGVGKTTLVKRLLATLPDKVRRPGLTVTNLYPLCVDVLPFGSARIRNNCIHSGIHQNTARKHGLSI